MKSSDASWELRAAPVAVVEIHGARALWRDAPEAMTQGVEVLRRTVEGLLESHRGELLDLENPAMAARFDDIFDAVDWALVLGEALVEADWPEALVERAEAAQLVGADGAVLFQGLRVAIGIDVGVLHTRVAAMSGHAFAGGETLVRAARLARAAPVGGVALGAAAADLLADSSASKDLQGTAVASNQAAWTTLLPDRLAEAGADTSSPGAGERRTNLPEFGGVFVDRVREFNALADALEGASRVAICGPAGAGKSRLAVEFARQWLAYRDAHDDASTGRKALAQAWFCDLSEAHSVDEAAFSVARTTGVQIPRSEALAELDRRLAAAFGERGPMLLVLDDVDALGSRFAASVARWLDGAPDLRVLTTGQRQPATPCAVVTVDALGRSSARALLEELLERPPAVPIDARAAHLREPQGLWEVVDACGRLPLALELVARSRHHRSADVDVTATSGESLDQLERALARSWQMLDGAQQLALQACTVFAGSFSARAAVSVIDAVVDVDAEELFSVLCQFSLLRSSAQSGQTARHVLLAPVRDFVVARADQAVVDRARRQHAAYFADWAKTLREQLEWNHEREWLDRADAELPNLYRAADYARPADPVGLLLIVEGLAEVNVRVGPLGGFGERTDQALAAAREAGRDELVLRALRVRSQALMWSGHYADAERDCREALRLARRLEDSVQMPYTLSALGFALGMQGKEDEGFPMVRQAAEQVRDDDGFEVITVLSNAALVARNRNEIDEATGYLHRALVHARRRENEFSQASVLFFLGTVLRHQQQWDEALRYLLEARELFESVGDRRGRLVSRHEIAACYTATDRFERAERCYAEAMELASAMGDRVHTAVFYLGRGRSRFTRGEYAAAESDLLEASILVEEEGHIQLKTATLLYLAAAYGTLERIGEARRYFGRVEQIFAETDITRERPLFEVLYGYLDAANARLAMRRGDEAAAKRMLRAAYERAESDSELQSALHEAKKLAAYLDERVERGELPAGISPRRAVLRVCEEMRWFAVDDAEPVDISRRGPIRRILRVLVEKRLEAPGETMTSDEILEAGWPGEVLTPQSASQRLYTTISRMRGLGLQDVLETFDGEYLIAPMYTPVWVERSA